MNYELMSAKGKRKGSFLQLLLALALLVSVLGIMYLNLSNERKKLREKGVKTFAVFTSIGYNRGYAEYKVNGKIYQAIKSMRSTEDRLRERLQVGDTVDVIYVSDEPEVYKLLLESWDNYRNR
jgi:hypothetical protein